MFKRIESRYLAIDLPDWPVQRLRHTDRGRRSRAVVLSRGDGRCELVTACSAEARRLGVRVGMKTPEAQALAGPGRLGIAPHSPRADCRALQRLAVGCERFSPVVALEDAEEPAALLLDVSGLEPLWSTDSCDGESRLAREVAEWLDSLRLAASIVVGPTVGLALAYARFGGQRETLLLPSDPRVSAERLPIEALRVEPTTCETLHNLGVDTIGELLRLPRASLPARFGNGLAKRLDQLLGAAEEPVESFQARPPLVAEWVFESSVSNPEVLERTLRVLLDRLVDRLCRLRRGALRVLLTYRLETPRESPLDGLLVLRLFRPTNSARELAELAKLQVDGLRFAHAVHAIIVRIGATAPIDNRQRTLFEQDARDDPHELAMLVNRLAGRVGIDRVSRVEKRRSVDPSRSFEYVPATDSPAENFDQTPLQAESARRLPLAMHGVGSPIEVITNRHGEPASVDRKEVSRCWGPQRVETGWWRGRGVRRDAYWVELVDGSRWWLCLDLRTRAWTLAGEFC